MVSYDSCDKVLFSADGFGKFGALDVDEDWDCEARRYYFNIVGKYGMLTFRLFFGDWYFIFLLLLGALGVYFLFVHHRFTIKNIRYLGTVMIALAIITLSHFAMHNFVSKYEGNSFKNTILLYFDYFKNGRNDMMIGGGLVGCILFYLLFLYIHLFLIFLNMHVLLLLNLILKVILIRFYNHAYII